MNKFMSSEEFEVWSQRHTPAEVQEKAIELQSQLAEELVDSAGFSREEYEAASPDERELIKQQGGEIWLEEAEAAEKAEREANPPEVGRLYITSEPDDDTVEVTVPVGGALEKKVDGGMVKGSFAEDSPEGQELVQAQFLGLHPEFQPSMQAGNLIRDRVQQSGARYFTLENIEEAFRELVAQGKIDIPYSFYKS